MTDNDEAWACPFCGAMSPEPQDECSSCGAVAFRVAGDKKRKTAILLALFFGWVGVHRFYLGQPVRGAIYLLFFWTFIPFLLSLIDALEYGILGRLGVDNKYNGLVPASER